MVRSPKLQKQWALYDEQEYKRALEQTQSLLVRLRAEDLRDGRRLVGLSCCRQKQYPQATNWLRRACEGSDQANDWLNLAVAATMQGNVEFGAEAFEQVRICQQAARYAQHPGFYLQLYGYACALCQKGEHGLLRPVLDELARAYQRLDSTDSGFLLRGGMPFLSSFLALAVRHFREQGESDDGADWLQALGEGLDEQGRAQVASHASQIVAID